MNKEYEKLLIENIKKLEDLIVCLANQTPKLTMPISEWMTLANAAKYAGVSYNSFVKFQKMGLKVSQIDGIKRVSRKEIDHFLESNSF